MTCPPQQYHESYRSSDLQFFSPTTDDEVTKYINRLSSASSNHDPLPTSLLKQLLPELAPVITKLVNESINTGMFPDMLKNALVRPLLKKATLDNNILKNYRPVSNIPFLSKVLEKVVAEQILAHLVKTTYLKSTNRHIEAKIVLRPH